MNLDKTDLQNLLICIDQTIRQNGIQGAATLCVLGTKIDAEIKRLEQEVKQEIQQE